MLSPDRPRRPFGASLASEVLNVGLAVRREALLGAAGLVITCLLLATTAIRYHEKLTLVPEMLLAALPVALLPALAGLEGRSAVRPRLSVDPSRSAASRPPPPRSPPARSG